MNLEQKLVRLVTVAAVTSLVAVAATTFVLYALGHVSDQEAEAGGPSSKVRVGTFDRTELADVLPALQDAFPEVAREKDLVLIVEQPLWAGADVESVDVTADLAARFESEK